ncbi:tetratricopeptide repeat-containing protein [Clostridium cochlearium]|uniref:tetratricopeptide repeat protein n=1 Tax=Clostridium cochlearium TaxID=1494 RepID=UPI001459A35B|nr:tetratricopeptide repeat protein [Clostridium cochlearium]NME94560.1 tetratricopeptide repeat-containing protein [Clostridium cochlearium]
MNKNTSKNIIIGLIVLFVTLGFGFYKYNRVKIYNDLVTNANKYMNSGDYDKAIGLFEQSLNYKKDTNIEKNIKLAENLKTMKKTYDDAIQLMNDKKYLDAIEKFEKITKENKENKEIYSNSQENIKKCKEKYAAFKKAEDAKKVAVIKKQQENKLLSPEDAVNIIKRKFPAPDDPRKCYVYDHDSSHDGMNFYVIHVYDNMGTHTATTGWYGVEKTSGRIYDELLLKWID